MKYNKIINNPILFYTITFAVPMCIFLLILYTMHIIPFGKNALLTNDMYPQYIQFYSELSERLNNGSSLLYSFRRGLGINYISEAAYYFVSPFNFILIFFNNKTMPIAISLLVTLKIGLAGLNMSVYLKKHFFKSQRICFEHACIIIALSCCYALSTYIIRYYTNIIWLDSVAMLPLVILALERLYYNDKPFLYSIYLGISILTNYYIGYMICLFCIIYYLYLMVTNYQKESFAMVTRNILRFVFYSLIAGALCACIAFPELYALSLSSSSANTFTSQIAPNYPIIMTFFPLLMSTVTVFSTYPPLYSTILIFIALPIYFVNKNITLRERIGKISILSLLLLSCQINIGEYIWNGFHISHGFSGRQSFIAIFVLLLICGDIMLKKVFEKKYACLYSYFIASIIIFIIYYKSDIYISDKCVLTNFVFLTSYFLLFKLRLPRKIYYFFISSLIFLEVITNSYIYIYSNTTINQYQTSITNTESILSFIKDTSNFYRIKNDTKDWMNEGSLIGYNSIPTVSSVANNNVRSFLSKIGFTTSVNAYNDYSWEPVFGSILSEKYIISSHDCLDSDILNKITTIDDLNIYQNRYALSLAFEVPDTVHDNQIFCHSNPFKIINNFANSIIPCNPIYSKLNMEECLSDNKILIPPGTDLYVYSKTELSECNFHFGKSTEQLYNGGLEHAKVMDNTITDNYIYHVANSRKGGYIQLKNGTNPKEISVYKLNEENYKKLMDKLSANQMIINTFNDSSITGKVSATYSGTMLTSIPFDKGWTVKIDGKKVKTFDIDNALLAFHIDKGEHTIEFSYIPVGLIAGSIISAVALCILITDIIRYYHKKSIS